MNKLTNIKYYKKEYVRALYGRHGRSSGLNPGVMWPRKEELQYLKQYEAAFCPKLEDLVAENETKKAEALAERKAREEQVLRDLKKLPEEFKKFFNSIEEKKVEREAWLKEREKVVEEVREILGYRAKPNDPRFQEALAEKEAEDLKAKKKEARKKREMGTLEDILTASLKK